MIRVRIALGVDRDGRWVASGWSPRQRQGKSVDSACVGLKIISGLLAGEYREYVLELDVPLPGEAATPLNLAVVDTLTGEVLV